VAREPTLAEAFAAVTFGGDDDAALTAAFGDADPLLAYGGTEAVASLAATFGERLVAHGGLHWVDERHRTGAPVTFVVRAGERELLRATHADGDGWTRWEREIPAELRGRVATVTFETTATTGASRSFCWSAVTLAPEDPTPTEAP